MTTEQLLFFLVAVLSVSTGALVWVTSLRLQGTVKLELDLGSRPLETALRERDQARALAQEWRNTAKTVTSQGAQLLRPESTAKVETVPAKEEKPTWFPAT